MYSQGTGSLNQSTPTEKLSDSWKEGMESRMDFLQTNLTKLLQLIKQGVGNEGRSSVHVLPDVQTSLNSPSIPEQNSVGLDPTLKSLLNALDPAPEINPGEARFRTHP